MLFITTLYLQQVLGFSALETGLAFVPLALSACAGGLTASRIVMAVGPRRAAGLSMVTSAAAFVLLSRTPADDGYLTHVLPAFAVAGFTFAAAPRKTPGRQPARRSCQVRPSRSSSAPHSSCWAH